MEPFTTVKARVAPLVRDDIDTDQIIPARFLKTTEKRGLGEHLFSDWRATPGFALTLPRHAGAQVLLAGANFGCGSSREHAPWALMDFGFRAVIATSFADIFRNNALGNGLLPVAVDPATHAKLRALIEADPAAEVAIDLATRTLTLPDGTPAQFPVDAFAAQCLLRGTDKLGYLLGFADKIAEFEAAHG
jgi:3-isopropylmalate/(R)-2-methylmalate dehydratase small subunit